jgi:CheY-like chemotaxis protein
MPIRSETRLNILAVDDEAGTRAALGIVLALAGHHAIFAKDGDEALEIFEKSNVPFDLIITDHQMSRVSGPELVRELRERGFKGEIAVLTAYAGTLDEQQYQKLNVAGIMEKPFDVRQLTEWIECIHGCREDAGADEQSAAEGRGIQFCWLKHRGSSPA